jgi:hypothetical protein
MATLLRTAHDDFARHYAEKIWELIPAIHRHEDGIAEHPGQLRALVEILADQAAIQRRSIDRLLADSRIDEADDWAVAYIGGLLGTRLLNPLNRSGRRADVGHTLEYRRRAGTARLLEALADDVADWAAVTHEAYLHLFRFPHALDRDFPPGPVTRTPRWGFPDMRRVRIGDVIGGPFEDMAYRPEFRRGRGTRGRYNIPNANLFCYRKYARPLHGVTPFRLDGKHYTFDPSGRDVPLYQPGAVDSRDCIAPGECDIRMPITCRRLNAAVYCLPEARRNDGPFWERMVGRRFESQEALIDAAADDGVGDVPGLLLAALVPDSPQALLLEGSDRAPPAIELAVGNPNVASFLPHQIAGAGLADWADGATIHPNIKAMVDPALGRLQLVQTAGVGKLQLRKHWYGAYWSEGVGAGTHGRAARVPDIAPAPEASTTLAWSPLSGDHFIGDSQTYRFTGALIQQQHDARAWARDGERPYVELRPGGGTELQIKAMAPGLTLELSGLWLGMFLTGANAGAPLAQIKLTGHWDKVVLRDVSIDPGGVQAALQGAAPVAIPHVRLLIDGQIEELVIDRCVLGSLHEKGAGGATPAATAARVTISDSILIGHGNLPALVLRSGEAKIDRTTILGGAQIGRAEISNTIIDGLLEVQDAQGSCLRFSAVWSGGRIPSPYECAILPEGLPAGTFESRSFGDPGLCVVTPACPEEIARGGEDGTEMGAFNQVLYPIKRADLIAKIAEFAPVQAVVQLIEMT